MRLATLANFSLALANGSHRPAGTLGKTKKMKERMAAPAGIAVTSPALLKVGVTKVCGVRTDGTVFMHDDDVVRCSNARIMTKAEAYLGYILAEYVDGDEAEPTRSDCVDRYIMNALQKHEAFLHKTRPANDARSPARSPSR